MFNIGGGRVVDASSNGDFTGTGNGPIDYGVAVTTADTALDYVGPGVTVTPEPARFAFSAGDCLGCWSDGDALPVSGRSKRRSSRAHWEPPSEDDPCVDNAPLGLFVIRYVRNSNAVSNAAQGRQGSEQPQQAGKRR